MRGGRRWIVPVVVVVGLALAVWLIATGGDDGTAGAPSTTQRARKGASTTTVPTRVTGTLDLSDTSQAAVAKLGGFVFPTSTADFLTARVNDTNQLDFTLTFEPGEEASLVAGSGLPMPATGTRVITHASPLWKLNPEGNVRGAADRHGDVTRQVELVGENDRIRVRAVITPAS